MGGRGPRSTRASTAIAIGAALAAGVALACAQGKSGAWTGARFVHAGRGYEVGSPGTAWSPIAIDGADVSLVGPGGALMSLSSRCKAPLAPPQVLARHLRFSIGDHELLESEALGEGSDAPWRQHLRVGDLEIETITALRGECIFDWVLAASQDAFPPAQPAFRQWRESFSVRAPRS